MPIAGLMALVLAVALGLWALAEPREGRAETVRVATLIALLAGVVGALMRRGPARAARVGFAVFGWGFFLPILFEGLLSGATPVSRAAASALADRIYDWAPTEPVPANPPFLTEQDQQARRAYQSAFNAYLARQEAFLVTWPR